MPGPEIQTVDDVKARVVTLAEIGLNCGAMQKGIDNYAIDIELDGQFLQRARFVIQEIVKRVVAGKRPMADADEIDAFRDAYADMVVVSLHKTKTGMSPEQVRIAHFGIIKFVLVEIKAQLDTAIKQVEETLGRQQLIGSRNLLVTQEKVAWLRKHYATFYYRATRAIFRHLQREETGQLRQLREQFLGDQMPELPNILFNPMLAVAAPVSPRLMLESYVLWPGSAEALGEANDGLEEFLMGQLPELRFTPLKPARRPILGEMEIYDQLGGLFGAQAILGAAVDQKDQVVEEFGWLDHPGNVRLLFDAAVHERMLAKIEGMRARRQFKSDMKKLRKIGIDARARFAREAQAREMIAGYVLRDEWSLAYDDILELPVACAYVAGNESRKGLARMDQSRDGAAGLVKQLDEWAKEVNRRVKEEPEEFALRILTDMSRFRLHLKYYRFAHRIFNRLNVITEPEKIRLSRAGGHLYRLLGSEQSKAAEPSEPEIVHHTILKADVRGSTAVTEELINQNLNPASYFSTRFFDPITELLATYGAVKVFIEGDAVILAIHEQNFDPQQWYSVSRACGIAREILDIVASKNAHSRQTGIPPLEIGIGICYSDNKPMFLFDEDRPMMISSAISEADRLSSCSWRLRQIFGKGQFNVEVLEIADADREQAEKGQTHLLYNVNGIVLDGAAFQKLKSEIRLRKLRVKIGDSSGSVYVGQFPDVIGKARDLVIREGVIGRWQNGVALAGPDGGQYFYEVLPNSKFASQVLELARSSAAKTG